jgi:hypothetical protein
MFEKREASVVRMVASVDHGAQVILDNLDLQHSVLLAITNTADIFIESCYSNLLSFIECY